ncbi:MAG: hypothetical protein CXR30_04935 [Geobacter sp.]|nr:MAG: hypothetical protein CXR30_04935 [Geobacter sp.]
MSKLLNYVIPFLLLLVFYPLPSDASQNIASAATHDKDGAASTPYSFAVIPFYSPEKIWLLYSPFVEYLAKTTGKPWELKLFHDHDEFINAICSGKTSIALAGPVPLSRAYEKCGAKPFLVALGKNGMPLYHSVLLTNDLTMKRVQDLRGKRIGFFKGSTAAHILPAKMLKDAGLGMSAIKPIFLDSQDRIMAALFSGEIVAAGVKETLYQKFAMEPLRVLRISDPLPNFAFCLTSAFPETLRQRLTKALLSLKPLANSRDAETVKGWDDEIKNGFMVPDKLYMPSVLKLHRIYEEVEDAR